MKIRLRASGTLMELMLRIMQHTYGSMARSMGSESFDLFSIKLCRKLLLIASARVHVPIGTDLASDADTNFIGKN